MIRRLLAAWRAWDRWLWAALWRAIREPKEPPHICGVDCDASQWYDTLPLPAVPDVDLAPPADDLPAATQHTGADEGYGAELHAAAERDVYIQQLADACGIDVLDPVTQPILEDAAAFHLAGEHALREFAGGWAQRVEPALRRFVGGPDRKGYRAFIGPLPTPVKPVHDFGDVLEVAGVHVMPARAVDWSTGEWELVPA